MEKVTQEEFDKLYADCVKEYEKSIKLQDPEIVAGIEKPSREEFAFAMELTIVDNKSED